MLKYINNLIYLWIFQSVIYSLEWMKAINARLVGGSAARNPTGQGGHY